MGQLTTAQKREKRVKAAYKLRNQLSVLGRTGTKADKKLIKEITPLVEKLSV